MLRSQVYLLAAVFISAAPAPKRDVILFLGDSLTAGYGVAPEEAYPALLQARWEKEKVPLKARNAGVSGATTADVRENLDWHLAPDVRVVFLAIGANDGLRGLDLKSSEKNLAAVIEAAQKRGALVVLAGMKLPPNYGPDYTKRFEAMYSRLGRRYGLKRLPFLLEGVAGISRYNTSDGIHPNPAGHRVIAEHVHAFLLRENLLQ